MPADASLLRLTVNARHTDEEIDRDRGGRSAGSPPTAAGSRSDLRRRERRRERHRRLLARVRRDRSVRTCSSCPAAAGLVGLAAAPPLAFPAFALAFSAFFVSYGLGQALTDVFQMDTDALSSPYRPLVRGEIGRGSVLAVERRRPPRSAA